MHLFHDTSTSQRPPSGRIHRVAGLFAGIGGLECGLHESGHRTQLLCENDRAAAEVLRERFPGVPVHGDIRALEALPTDITLVTAGFPCQDLSQAGRTLGISGQRSGLVGEVFRLIEQERTPWVLLENVPFMLQLGRGRAMEVIASSFEELGYSWAYRVIDARAFGLPQRRKRVFLLASCEGDPRTVIFADEAENTNERIVAGPPCACGFYWTEGVRGLGWAVDSIPTLKGGSTVGIPSPPAILLTDGRVVVPNIRDAERLQGFAPDWTLPAERIGRVGMRWKLVGNAVSAPVSRWIGGRLAQPGTLLDYNLRRIDGNRWPVAAWNVGDGRVAVDASEWPVQHTYLPLQEFLCYEPKLLSARASRGFLTRAARGTLRFPDGFLDAIAAHRARMEAAEKVGEQPPGYGLEVGTLQSEFSA